MSDNNKKSLFYRKAVYLKNRARKESGASSGFFEKKDDAVSKGTIELDIGNGDMYFHESVRAAKDFINIGTGRIFVNKDFTTGGNVNINGDLFIAGNMDVKGDLCVKGCVLVEGNFKLGGKVEVGGYRIEEREAFHSQTR